MQVEKNGLPSWASQAMEVGDEVHMNLAHRPLVPTEAVC